jgi:hypothetical protein
MSNPGNNIYLINGLNINLPPGGKIVMDALSVFGNLKEDYAIALMLYTKEVTTTGQAKHSLKTMKRAELISVLEDGSIASSDVFQRPVIGDVNLIIFAFISLAGADSILAPAIKMGAINNNIVFHNGQKVYETVVFDRDDQNVLNQIEYYTYQRSSKPFITPVVILKGFDASDAERYKLENPDTEVMYTNENIKGGEFVK